MYIIIILKLNNHINNNSKNKMLKRELDIADTNYNYILFFISSSTWPSSSYQEIRVWLHEAVPSILLCDFTHLACLYIQLFSKASFFLFVNQNYHSFPESQLLKLGPIWYTNQPEWTHLLENVKRLPVGKIAKKQFFC